MSLAALPLESFTYAEWDAELGYTLGLCAPYTMDTPDGPTLNPDACPGPLAARYASLMEHGLERGWLTLDRNGHPRRDT